MIQRSFRLAKRRLSRHGFLVFRGSMVMLAMVGMLFNSWMIPQLFAQSMQEKQVQKHLYKNRQAQRYYIDDSHSLSEQQSYLLGSYAKVVKTIWQDYHSKEGLTPQTADHYDDLVYLHKQLKKLNIKAVLALSDVANRLKEVNAPHAVVTRHDKTHQQLVDDWGRFEKLHQALINTQNGWKLKNSLRALDQAYRFVHPGRGLYIIQSYLAPQLLEPYLKNLPIHENKAANADIQTPTPSKLLPLPRRQLHATNIKSESSKAHASLDGTPTHFPYFYHFPWQLADAGDVISSLLSELPGDVSPATGPVTEDDLAATTDIQKDDAMITALAQELEHDPVKIYEYVRNELVYEPYFGAMKGSRKTLIEKAGNDIDLSSAMMALLRASGYNCRYVFGTVEMSVDEAAAWVGVDDPNQVAKVFTDNQIPVEFDYAAGAISTVRLDHVWVQVYLDHFPYLGAVQDSPDTWLYLVGSFKQNTYTGSRDVIVQVGVSPETFLTNIKASSTIDSQTNSATNVPESFILGELELLSEPVRNYLAANELTTETVFRQRTVNEERFGLLPVTDQYKLTATGLKFSQLPDALRHHVDITLRQADGSELLNYRTNLVSLAEKRITLSYDPATEDDRLVAESFAETSEFPAYLMSLTPVLKVDGQIVATGSNAVGMGREQELEVAFETLDGSVDRVIDEIAAGGYHALVLNDQQMVSEYVQQQAQQLQATSDKLSAYNLSDLNRDNTIGDLLHGLGISYFHQIDRFNQITAGNLGVAPTRMPSLVRVSWDLSVEHQFGLPLYAAADRVRVHVGRDLYVPIAITRDAGSVTGDTQTQAGGGGQAAENQFMFTAALTSNALEHNVLLQALPDGGEAISAVRVIQAANKDGVPIYTITPENVTALTTEMEVQADNPLPQTVIESIRDAVNAEREVTVAGQSVWIDDHQYVAYLQRDLQTSDSGFFLQEVGVTNEATTGSLSQGGARVAGGEQINTMLNAADLLSFDATQANASQVAGRLLTPVASTASWLNVAEDVTTNAGLSYLPAISDITAWYKKRLAPGAQLDPVTTIASAIAVSGPISRVSAQPGIFNVQITDTLISPNSDGTKDSMHIEADVTRNAQWTVTLKDS